MAWALLLPLHKSSWLRCLLDNFKEAGGRICHEIMEWYETNQGWEEIKSWRIFLRKACLLFTSAKLKEAQIKQSQEMVDTNGDFFGNDNLQLVLWLIFLKYSLSNIFFLL